MDKYKISIIIPVYNVALYIADCLNSIISQKGDYEVVIVNDGTEDESIDIAMRLTKGLKNITIINKSNGGLSSARNAGLKVASGDYISFVDSDDIVHEDYIKLISDEIDKNDADMIVFDYVKGSDTNEIKSSLKNQKKSKHRM